MVHHSFIIAVPNLTMSALKINYEWNVPVWLRNDHGQIDVRDIQANMEKNGKQLNY